MKNNATLFLIVAAFTAILSCTSDDQTRLPILGNVEIKDGDTTYHEIPQFSFVNQDSLVITNETFADQIYIADFFFTSCPSICPKVKKQMLRMYDRYSEDDRISFLSHSIDTKRDSVARLKQYSSNLGVRSDFWHFVTGDKDKIFSIADDYFVAALEDASAPGGYDHSGRIILVDKDRHIRSFCDGTNENEVDLFMEDIDKLLNEQ